MGKEQYITNSMKMKYDVLYNFISPVTGNITSGSIAPSNATYILQKPNSSLPNAQALSSLSSGVLFNNNDAGQGVLSASQRISIDNLPNLTKGRFWIGNNLNVPRENSFADAIKNAIDSAIEDFIWGKIGDYLKDKLGINNLKLLAKIAQLAGLVGLIELLIQETSPGGSSNSQTINYIAFNANIDMSQNRITNLSSSIQNNYDAVNAQWVWDLLNDKLLINSMGLGSLTVGNINPELYILGSTQAFNYNQNLSTFRLNNSFSPTNYISNQTLFEFRNNLFSGYRWVHNTNSTDTYGSLTLQSFVNASSSGTNLLNFSSSGIGTFAPLQFYNSLGTHYVALQAGTLTSNTTWTLPTTDGAYGQALITNGSGVLSWSSTGVGSVTSITAGTGLTGGTITTSGTIGLDTPVSLANGGTGANLIGSVGGILYSTASTVAILAGTSTANQMLLSGASAAPVWSTVTHPSTTTINQLLYSSANNVISGLSTANNGVLVTSSGGAPSIGTTLPSAVQGNITSLGTITIGTWNGSTVSVSHGGTGIISATAYSVLCGGTTLTGAFQSVSGLGTSGQVLTSQGANALPTWQTPLPGTVSSISQGSNIVCTPNPITLTGTVALSNTLSGLTSIGVGNFSLSGNTISSTNTNGDINISPNGSGVFTVNAGPIGSTQWSNQSIFYGNSSSGNLNIFKIINVRYTTGTDWNSSEIRLQKIVDATYQHYISFRGNSGNISNLVFGFGGLTGGTELAALSQDGKLTIGSTTPTTVSALVELQSTTGALLLSRLTTTQRDALTAPTAGMILYNNTTSAFECYIGGSWKSIISMPALTNGQLIIGSTGNNPVAAVPTNGTNISWTTGSGSLTANLTGQVAVTNGGTGLSSATAYSVLCGGITPTGAFQSVSGLGTYGQILTSQGASSLPTWTTRIIDTAGGGTYNFFAGTNSGVTFSLFSVEAFAPASTCNIAVGYNALSSLTIGSNNIGIGYYALNSNTSGSNNTAIGYQALKVNTVSNNTAVGYNCLYNNTTGNNNVGLGSNALQANTIGYNNIGIGYYALYSNTSGYYNVALGSNALQANSTGFGNLGIGYYALNSNSTGVNNIGIGINGLANNNTGSENIAIGAYTLTANTTGNDNTAIGNNSLYGNTIGNNNVGVGASSGQTYSSNLNCTFVGAYADSGADNLLNATAIGYGATVSISNAMVLGNSSVKVGIGTNSPGYKLDVNGDINTGTAFFTSGGQTGGGIYFLGDAASAQWQICIPGFFRLAFRKNNGSGTYVTQSYIDGGGNYVTVSDIRLKRDIKLLNQSKSLKRILDTRICHYNRIDYEQNNDSKYIGVIAQEQSLTNPHCVQYTKDGYASVAYNDIFLHNVNATKELYNMIVDLKKEMIDFKNQIFN